jgi:hypothetical protein
MKLRIAIWAAVGAVVVLLWTIYLVTTHSNPSGAIGAFLDLTCPIAIFRRYPLSIYFVLATNAATYAFIGTVVETVRWQYKHLHPITS